MTRCQSLRAPRALAACLSLGLAILVATAPTPSHAQETIRRDTPRDVILAKMTVSLPPVIQMDGKDDRLSPGSRIRDVRNMVVLSGSLAGSTVPVVYKRDSAGLVHEVWILTADEYKQLGGTSGNGQAFLDLLAAIFGMRR